MLRNKVVKQLCKAKADFILEHCKGNPKLIWNHLKKLTGQHPKERKMFELKIDGKHTNNPVEVANAFNQYFIYSGDAIAQTFPPVSLNISQINTSEPAFNLQNVMETEVTQIIKSMKISRATDVYGIHITKLINQSFTQGACPSVWESVAVIPTYLVIDHLRKTYKCNRGRYLTVLQY